MSTFTAADASNLFRQEPDRYIDVGEGEVALRTVGTGPDVLFVHGWPVNGATFRYMLPHLVDHVTCHIIDFPSTGSSRFDTSMDLSVENHIVSVRKVVDALGVDSLSVVGHDSGGMVARHALVGDSRVRSMGLINTEQPPTLGWRFRLFLSARRLPGFANAFGALAGNKRLRKNKFVLGDAFVDRSLLEGEFDEFFLTPLHRDKDKAVAATKILRSFSLDHVSALGDIHQKLDMPVVLVWGDQDPFFPVKRAREMVSTFPNAHLVEVPDAGLFALEERPEEVAKALLPTLLG